jgi:HD-like signal output (HDOD) protein
VVSEVLRQTEDPKAAMDQMSKTIQADPALTAKILRVSNSPYYGMKQYVGTLKLALVILGVREVRNIVLGISVFETLKESGPALKSAQEIWLSSLRVASLAKRLCEEIELGLQGEEFITGLLHDIGKMVLLRQLADRYARIYMAFKDFPERLYAAELQEFGFTNADAATALAVRWNLPQTLVDALWYQYPNPDRPLANAKDPRLAAVVRIAKYALHDDLSQEGAQSLLDEEAWEVLQTAKNPMPPSERAERLKSMVEEIKKGPELPI